jgi:glycosyl-4,4'-diaponeurosporenoate acyltransferase
LAVTLVADVVAWTVIGIVVGYTMHRWPTGRLERDGPVTRIRPFEQEGRLYVRLGIRRWKDRLPEAGALFRGGVSKRSTGGPEAFDRFVVETRRAELTHWWVLAAAPLFALWNPWPLTAVMVAYAIVANVPCIAIQRYNRARLGRIGRRSSARRRP